MLYCRSLLVIYFKYSSVYMPIPNFLNVSYPHPSPLDFIITLEHLEDAAHIQDVSDSIYRLLGLETHLGGYCGSLDVEGVRRLV